MLEMNALADAKLANTTPPTLQEASTSSCLHLLPTFTSLHATKLSVLFEQQAQINAEPVGTISGIFPT